DFGTRSVLCVRGITASKQADPNSNNSRQANCPDLPTAPLHLHRRLTFGARVRGIQEFDRVDYFDARSSHQQAGADLHNTTGVCARNSISTTFRDGLELVA